MKKKNLSLFVPPWHLFGWQSSYSSDGNVDTKKHWKRSLTPYCRGKGKVLETKRYNPPRVSLNQRKGRVGDHIRLCDYANNVNMYANIQR